MALGDPQGRPRKRVPDAASRGCGGKPHGSAPSRIPGHIDLAVAGGLAAIGDPARVAGLDPDLVRRGLEWIERAVDEAVDR
ncbi:MAG: hydantoinase/oxoprolinase family protein, partial [Egibacteraceae bacterium]